MIKFFRKIRYKLMSENKTSRYIKYAIGEIILVVIGILIALQVNTYYQTIKDQADELEYLQGIHQDLRTLIVDFEESKRINIGYVTGISEIVEDYIKNDGFIASDALLEKNNTINSVSIPAESKTTFLELENAGEIKLIRNKDLRRHIVQFYQDLDKIMFKSRSNISNIYQQHDFPILSDRTLRKLTTNYSTVSDNLEELIVKRDYSDRTKALVFKKIEDENYEIEYLNALNSKAIISKLFISRAEMVIKNAKELMQQIETELKKEHGVDINNKNDD